MQAGTIHAVITIEPTVMSGSHFYTSNAAKLSVPSLVHAFLMDNLVTNAEHDNIGIYREESMARYMEYLVEEVKSSGLSGEQLSYLWHLSLFLGSLKKYRAHDLSWYQPEDLKNILGWGNLLIFADTLDGRTYMDKAERKKANNITMDDSELRQVVRDRYREIWGELFTPHAIVLHGGQEIDAFQQLVEVSALHFAKALLLHYRRFNASKVWSTWIASFTEEKFCQSIHDDLARLTQNNLLASQFLLNSKQMNPQNEDEDTLLKDWSDLEVHFRVNEILLHAKEFCDIYEESYTSVVNSSLKNSTRQRVKEAHLTYGEIGSQWVTDLQRNGTLLGKKSEFLDIGAGLGNIMTQFACQLLCRANGIEIREDLVQVGQRLFEDVRSKYRTRHLREVGQFNLIHDDLTTSAQLITWIKSADFILCNNFVFTSQSEWIQPEKPSDEHSILQ